MKTIEIRLSYFENGIYLGPDKYGVEPLFQEFE